MITFVLQKLETLQIRALGVLAAVAPSLRWDLFAQVLLVVFPLHIHIPVCYRYHIICLSP